MTRVIGIDIGGTKVAIGVVSSDGELSNLTTFPTPSGGQAIIALLLHEVKQLMTVDCPDPIAGVGVGTGGVVDNRTGTVLYSTDLIKQWAGCHLAAQLGVVGLPVKVANDGLTFALGEATFGAGVGHPDCAYVAIGTGVGGAVMVDGRLRLGPRFVAGEFGHIVYPTSRICSCGKPGHIEAVASGPSMTAAYEEASGNPVANLREVAALALAGDGLAKQVLAEGARALGQVMAGVVMSLDLPVVVLGGGVGIGLGEQYRRCVSDTINQTLPHGLATEVFTARLTVAAGVVGAGVLAMS